MEFIILFSYFIFFFLDVRRSIRPWFLESDGVTPKSTKIFYDILCTCVVGFSLNYTMAPFVVNIYNIYFNLFNIFYFLASWL